MKSIDRNAMDAVVGGAKDIVGVNGFETADKRVCDAAQRNLSGKKRGNWFANLAPEQQAVGIQYCKNIGLIKKRHV